MAPFEQPAPLLDGVPDAFRALLSCAERASARDQSVRRALAAPPDDVQEALCSLLLELAMASDARAPSHGSTGAAPRTGGKQPVHGFPPLGEWVEPETRASLARVLRVRPDARAHDLGKIHEALLELRVLRLDAPSICLRPSGTWLSAERILAASPPERSRRVQRAASLPKSAVERFAVPLARARSAAEVLAALEPMKERAEPRGDPGKLVVDRSLARRRAGAHYTPKSLALSVVERALRPLLRDRSSREILALRICDPAMGSGVFLSEAAELLADALLLAWSREGRNGGRTEALASVIGTCLRGVDRDPTAVRLARFCLSRLASADGPLSKRIALHLLEGDSLVGTPSPVRPPASLPAFDWPRHFPDVFAPGEPGFDACIGNPPWVAYVGRAAQPLDPARFDYYLAANRAFGGYRTLHGLFVRRAAELLRIGGRLGLILPTSVADLSGYAPTRAAHDALCAADDALCDFGNGAFEGVYQPCMGLTSTRVRRTDGRFDGDVWQLARTDLTPGSEQLLARLAALPTLEPSLFGERGFQSTHDDLAHIAHLPRAKPPYTLPIHEGVDVREMSLSPPGTFLNPRAVHGRLRGADDWRAVGVLVRQTARYPIAALSDGLAFRNSVLAGFAGHGFDAPALALYLNSSAARWYHFTRHRDARQGMPQLKIGHLRALPALPEAARAALGALGSDVSSGKLPWDDATRQETNRIVFDALGFSADERALVLAWARENPAPRSRRSLPESNADPIEACAPLDRRRTSKKARPGRAPGRPARGRRHRLTGLPSKARKS